MRFLKKIKISKNGENFPRSVKTISIFGKEFPRLEQKFPRLEKQFPYLEKDSHTQKKSSHA
jgi:hypothetical protein